MPTITLHKYQKQAIFSEKRITAMIAGLQSGKTFSGSLWLRYMISRFSKEKDSSFIVCFPTYSICNSSTLPAFLRNHHELGHLNKTEKIFYMYHGPRVYLRSMDNPWSCEGVSGCRGIWVDEGGLISTQAFINLMGRAAPKEAQIFISTTPYNLNNYLYRDLYEPWAAGERDDVEIVQFTSRDNPYFPESEYIRQQQLLDPRTFAMRYEGQFRSMQGLVYADWDRGNYYEPHVPRSDRYHIMAGVDWGYTDPFAIIVMALSRDGTHTFIIDEFKQSGLTPDQQIQIAKQLQQKHGIVHFYADSADPGLINLWGVAKLPIVGVKKVKQSLPHGISLLQELVRTNEIKVLRGCCPEWEKELELYSYPESNPDKPAKEVPIDLHNHLCDAARYLILSTQHIRRKAHRPYKPQPTHLQRLLRGDFSRKSKGEDDWS